MAITVKDLPGPKGAIRNVSKLKLDDLHNVVGEMAKEYGGVYKLKLPLGTIVVITDPDINNEILQRRPDEFIRMVKMDQVIRRNDLHGVFNAEGDDWKMHRDIVARGLDVKHQIHFYPHIKHVTERLYNKWEKDAESGNVINIQQDLLRFTVDVTTYLAFGHDMNTMEEHGGVIQDHLEKIFPMIFKRINMPIPWYRFIRSKADREFDHSVEEIKKVLDTFIENGRKQLRENPELREKPENALQAILVAAEEHENFGDVEIKGNLMTLLLAGEDTTAHTLAWGIYLMSQHEEVVDEIRKEADEILGDNRWMQEYSNHTKLKYIESVGNEIMRLKPVAPLMLNEPTADTQVREYIFPKGTHLMMQTRIAATDDKNFSNGMEFNPGRWMAATKCPVHNPKAMMPFGGGPRYCPGRNLALLEIKVVLSMLYKNFDVELLTPYEEVKEIMAFTMMASDYEVKLKKRTN